MKKSIICALFLGFFVTSQNVLALECNGQAINPGMTRNAVLAACGKPFFRDKKWVARGAASAGEEKPAPIKVRIEEWGYHLKADNLTAVITFENGKLAFSEEGNTAQCSNADIPAGATKLILFLQCGEPDRIDEREEEIYLESEESGLDGMHRIEFIEEWTYDSAAQHFIFKDGQLQR